MSETLELIAPGARVDIGGGWDGSQWKDGRPGLVLIAAVGMGGQVTYLVAWWDGGQRHEQWAHAAEILPLDVKPPRTRVGFRAGRPVATIDREAFMRP